MSEYTYSHIFKNGDKVRFNERGEREHKRHPCWYPAVGTIGKIVDPVEFPIDRSTEVFVQWPKEAFDQDTEPNDGGWCCDIDWLDLVEEGESK